jgi:hypothetical protein
LDGHEGSLVNGHVIRNGYIIASGDGGVAMDLINTDDNSVVALENLYFMEVVEGQKINRVSHTVGVVSFTNILLNVDAIALHNHVNGDIPTGVNDGTPQTPFVNSEDFQWSWAYQEGNIL